MEEQLRPGRVNGVDGWWRPNGTFMPVISGAQDDPPAGGKDEDDDKDKDEEEDEEEEDEEEEIKDPKARVKALEAEKDRHAKKSRKLESELHKAAERIKALEDATKTDEDKRAERLTELEKKVTDLERSNSELTVRNTLLSHPDIARLSPVRRKWVIRELAEQFEEDDDGNNLEEILDELKEQEPTLFETADESDDDDDEEEETPPKRKTAPRPKRRKDKDTQTDVTSLEGRLPALKKHRGPAA